VIANSHRAVIANTAEEDTSSVQHPLFVGITVVTIIRFRAAYAEAAVGVDA
jgi:hypothetical protein